MAKIILVTFLFVFQFCLPGAAQIPIESRAYPQNFFRYPLDLPPSTAGSFGELRGMHFHSGLDFKTNQRTGYPVHAVYDGFISRLRVQFGGFGNAVYITHPNGYTSVYGHLERFAPQLEKIVREYQYKQQTFEADIVLAPNQITVCKGEIFAWSGNAGASAGPHLHFELRDSATEETINPQLFGLTIPDKVPPAITAIGIYHLDGKPFSEKTQKEFLPVTGAAGNYHLSRPMAFNLSGQIGFGLAVYDINSTSANHNGIYSLELKLDGKTIYTFAVERFAFTQTHALNAYIDYPAMIETGRIMQKCFILPGSKISLYPQSVNGGLVTFNDGALHAIQYVVKDVAGNTSILTLNIKAGSATQPLPVFAPSGILFHYDKRNEFSNEKVKVIIEPGNLYDDLDFNYAEFPEKPGTYSPVYRIHNRLTPIHDSYQLWIRPDAKIGQYASKAVIVNTNGTCEGGTYEDGYIKADARSFGDFYIKLDTVPPFIIPINIKNGVNLASSKKIVLRIGDALSGIKSYSGTIDGKWVLMEWDFKTRVLSYSFDNSINHQSHIFELTVTDNKNNVSKYKANFYR
jgi:hypothetical protein